MDNGVFENSIEIQQRLIKIADLLGWQVNMNSLDEIQLIHLFNMVISRLKRTEDETYNLCEICGEHISRCKCI